MKVTFLPMLDGTRLIYPLSYIKKKLTLKWKLILLITVVGTYRTFYLRLFFLSIEIEKETDRDQVHHTGLLGNIHHDRSQNRYGTYSLRIVITDFLLFDPKVGTVLTLWWLRWVLTIQGAVGVKDIVKILVKEHTSLSAKTFGLGEKKIYIT